MAAHSLGEADLERQVQAIPTLHGVLHGIKDGREPAPDQREPLLP